MEGIDILNKTEIMTTPFLANLLFFLFIILFLAGFCIFIYGAYVSSLVPIIISIAMISVSIFFLWQACLKESTESTGRYRYEVTIDDSVSFLDLQEKYDVIEQNGKIWTLEDKEVKE